MTFSSKILYVVQQELGWDDRLMQNMLCSNIIQKDNRPMNCLTKTCTTIPLVINIIAEFKEQTRRKTAEQDMIP